jgi:hypothetical protein
MKEHSLKSVAFATKHIKKLATLSGLLIAVAAPALGAPNTPPLPTQTSEAAATGTACNKTDDTSPSSLSPIFWWEKLQDKNFTVCSINSAVARYGSPAASNSIEQYPL